VVLSLYFSIVYTIFFYAGFIWKTTLFCRPWFEWNNSLIIVHITLLFINSTSSKEALYVLLNKLLCVVEYIKCICTVINRRVKIHHAKLNFCHGRCIRPHDLSLTDIQSFQLITKCLLRWAYTLMEITFLFTIEM
jgi:hypothetical protein